jgi:hypothetical protein
VYNIPNVVTKQRKRDSLGFAQTGVWKLTEIREGTYKGRLSVCLGKEGSKRINIGTESWRIEFLY